MTATNPGWAPPATTPGPAPPPGPVGGRIYAPATPPSQVATAACCSAAVMIVCVAAQRVDLGVAISVGLGAGALISVATPVGEQRFHKIAGAMVALLVAVGLTIGGALVLPDAGADLFFLVPVAAAFVLGLDWRRVERLRPLPLWSGLLVLIGVASAEPWTYLAAVIWGLVALTTLHLLEVDRRAALAHLRPLRRGEARQEARTSDLAATIVAALLVAAVLALLLSAPSCRNLLHPPKNPTSFSPPQGRYGQGQGQGGQGQGQGGQGQGGQGGANGQGGQAGGQGRGGRGGSGTRGSSDHTYVPDPNGDFLIPNDGTGGQGGAGTRRVPGPTLRSGLPSSPDPGGTGARTGPGGSTRDYRHFADGRDQVTVRDADGRTRTFTYYPPESDGTRAVIERDGNGRFQRRYTYVPNGRLRTGPTGEPGQSGSGSGSAATPKPKKKDDHKGPSARLIAIILLVAGALALLIWWLVKRSRRPSEPPPPAAPPWAIELARRLDLEGRRRGRPRGVHESVVTYAATLGEDELADPRLAGIGRILSRALFSRDKPGDDERQWAETSFDQIVEAHPTQRGPRRTAQTTASQ